MSYVHGNDIVPRLLYHDPPSRANLIEWLKSFHLVRTCLPDLNEDQLPTFPPMGEYRALPQGKVCEPSSLLPCRTDGPITSYIDDHSMLRYVETLGCISLPAKAASLPGSAITNIAPPVRPPPLPAELTPPQPPPSPPAPLKQPSAAAAVDEAVPLPTTPPAAAEELATSPATMPFVEKVKLIKENLGLEGAPKDVLAEANEQMGLTTEGPLPKQAEALIAALGL